MSARIIARFLLPRFLFSKSYCPPRFFTRRESKPEISASFSPPRFLPCFSRRDLLASSWPPKFLPQRFSRRESLRGFDFGDSYSRRVFVLRGFYLFEFLSENLGLILGDYLAAEIFTPASFSVSFSVRFSLRLATCRRKFSSGLTK